MLIKTLYEVNDDTMFPDLIIQRDQLNAQEELFRSILHITEPINKVSSKHRSEKQINTTLTLIEVV